MGREIGGLLNDKTDIAATRIEAEPHDPVVELGQHIHVHEPEEADAADDEQGGFQELEERDQADECVLRGFHGIVDYDACGWKRAAEGRLADPS